MGLVVEEKKRPPRLSFRNYRGGGRAQGPGGPTMIPLTGPAIITSSLLIILRDDSDLTSVSSTTLLEYIGHLWKSINDRGKSEYLRWSN